MLNLKNQKGFAALYITILVLAVIFGIAVSITILTYGEQKISRNIIKSSQAYYVAEAGIEDSVYRIIKGKKYEATNSLSVGGGLSSISITSQDDKRIIQSTGEISQRIKKLETILKTESATVAFYYGAQIDKGGLWLGANASVEGNVYSNGKMEGQGKGSGSKISGDAWVAGAVAPEPDQQWTSQDSDFPFGLKIGKEYYLDTAQSFVPSVSKVLNTVSFYIKKVGDPPDQTVRILADDNGQPSQTPLASGILKSSKITSSYSWIDVSFDPPPNLTAGIIYWIMIDVSRDDDDYWIWGKDSTDGYTSGTGKYTKDWDTPGATWTSVGGDLNFKTWMGGETPTYIDRVWVGRDAHANTIADSWIDGDAYYQTIDARTTVSGTKYPNSPDPATKDLPISYAQIQDWEKAACCDTGSGCKAECVSGSYSPLEGSSLGSMKIEGDLTFPSNSDDNPVIIAGPVWVTGKILASNNAGIKLKSGLESGYPIIADNPADQTNFGKVELNNNVITTDSPQGGRLLFVSTNKSLDPANPAIHLYNNINVENPQSIIYTLNGLIVVENNAEFVEVTGYAIRLENNTKIVYQEGLINSNFSSGPGGGWEVTSWKETE
ncbi:MAG: hypothetical protein AUJ31_02200 [Parcubacteria group bacterium CG1_02_39_15]|uniref:Type 4 fimbrial biogenesis protein PilX N-terminal domain-containing protein n=2 Tax=Candidatus Nealsoniibacteriota TaxID=1817911 RepID=A0A2H0MPH0_9BACT|nr:MAG: hypothetical protein AUJ31_02200 [Parcubacteria group bacterium CG1_02_39_15]PIQ98552.1 MAG: hypothetical protein COV64_00625 [Candidatus Nealsonbacteria bacterium CG11_big_fil_rev_8_21_14_0_20_39_9]PIZ88431.1 MAG: hypothetical protein COX91_00200 [Candidatus Nealsonbacteria bacterium CG_4_10_14_0_2_um_filter_39_15]